MKKEHKQLLFWLGLGILIPTILWAAESRISQLGTTATSPAADDYTVLDGSTKGTRKILPNNLIANITGGAATYGSDTISPIITVNADGRITSISNATISAGSGNVTSGVTLASGNIVVGNGTKDVVSSNIVVSGNNITLGSTGQGNLTANVITANNITITDFNVTNLAATNASFGGKNIVLGGNFTVSGSSNLTLTTSATTNATFSSGTYTLAKEVIIPLTIDTIADGQDYAMFYTPRALTVTKLGGVHAGSGLSSPSIVATFKHGTDRTSATTIEAVTITSSTTGTFVTASIDDATVPADSFIWVTLGSKSGTTANLEVFIIGNYD